MWLKQFKIALIEKNTKQLDNLMDELPTLKDPQEIQQALHLLQEATHLVETLKNQTNSSLQIMKRNIAFLNATQDISSKKLNCHT